MAMEGITGWLRALAYDVWIGLKPSRFGILIVLLLLVLLLEPWTGQGRDVLYEYAIAAFSPPELYKRLWLYLAVVCLGILTWGLCRLSSTLRFPGEEQVLLRYRKLFPRPPFDPADDKQQGAIDADARIRVARIYWLRKWAPRGLGVAVPLVVAGCFYLSAGLLAWKDILICLGLAAAIAMVIPRRRIQNWMADKAAKMGRPRLSSTLEVRDDPKSVATWSELGGFVLLLLAIAGVMVAASVVLAALVPLEFGHAFGPLPVIMLALAVILMLGSLVAMRARITNFPWFFTSAIVFLVVASAVSGHHMRFVKGEDVVKRLRPEDLATKFGAKQGAGPKLAILVAAAGGGSRAAYWTATVLGELNRQIPDFNNHLLLVSGVSGGSVGALFYRASTQAMPDDPEKALNIAQGAASGDFLSPLLSSMFTRDLFSGVSGLPDRAEAVERAWSRSFTEACRKELKTPDEPCRADLEKGFLTLWSADGPAWPALILNGTVVETGARVVASNLDLHCDGDVRTCGLVDVMDILAYQDQDLMASTAANVSARFPILGPSARFFIDGKKQERSVVDGGYFDNFGAFTLQQVSSQMAEVFKREDIVPIVIQITSDPDFSLPPYGLSGRLDLRGQLSKDHQFYVPLRTYFSLRRSHGMQAMLALQSWAVANGKYFHFDQCLPEGAAPLAWVISRRSQENLKATVKAATETCNNEQNFAAIDACLKDPGSCKPQH
jgi:hypothetical protein